MRISTTTIFQSGVSKIGDLQSSLMKTQQQLSTGKRILTPADDPVAAAQALNVSENKAINSQMTTNRSNAKDALNSEEGVLASVTNLLQNVKTAAVNAGDASLSDSDRKTLAVQLKGQLQDLIGLANSRDGMGNYLFAGFNLTSQPYVTAQNGATYVGDQGQRNLQVSLTRQLALGDSGDAIFDNVVSGSGGFDVAAASTLSGGVMVPTNTGTGVSSPATVTNSAALTGDAYQVLFHVTGGVTTYDVINTTTSATVSSGQPYTSGQSIGFDGVQLQISGDPADTDSFSVSPSGKQSIFTTISNLINTLNAPAGTPAGKANLTNGLNAALSNIDNGLDNVLTVRSSVGLRLQELDDLDDLGSSIDLQYSSTLSNLQDLDYAKAITDLTQTQTMLDAAQKSFIKISGLSLFNLL